MIEEFFILSIKSRLFVTYATARIYYGIFSTGQGIFARSYQAKVLLKTYFVRN